MRPGLISHLQFCSLLFYYSRKDHHFQPLLPLPPPVSHKIPAVKIKRRKLCFRTPCGHSPREKPTRINLLIYIQTSLFFLPPRHSYLCYRIFSAVGELSQNPFYKQHGKENQKNPRRFWIRPWHTVQLQMSKSSCPAPPFCYFNCISVLCILPLLETFISLVTPETRQQFVEQRRINLWNFL